MKLLVCFNNFFIGGRETYVDAYLSSQVFSGAKVALLANHVDSSLPQLELFDEVVQISSEEAVVCLRRWIEIGGQLIEQFQPDVLWAHHYTLLPIWLLSQIHGIPMLSTFHGPLVNDNRSNCLLEACGMTLAIHRSQTVSAVSQECIDGIHELASREKNVYFLPNAVSLSARSSQSICNSIPQRFLLVSRFSKLKHLRAAVQLFAEYRKKYGVGTLTIVGGEGCSDKSQETFGSSFPMFKEAVKTSRLLGRKWCMEQGGQFLRSLAQIKTVGYSSSPRKLMAEHDVVLGMGRVLIEAIAENRTAVLVGYESVIDVLTESNFLQHRLNNFSGRDSQSVPLNKVCEEIHRSGYTSSLTPETTHTIDVRYWAEDLYQSIAKMTFNNALQDKFVEEIAHTLSTLDTQESDIFKTIVMDFSEEELSSLYRLSSGR